MEAATATKTTINQVEIIERATIPPLFSVVRDGQEHKIGELRDFSWVPSLKKFIPENQNLSFSWVHLRAGEILKPHAHPEKSMIIIVKGSGQILGQKNQTIKEGDIAIIPPNCAHGFECSAQEEFFGLSIQFGSGFYSNPENAKVGFLQENYFFNDLLEYNNQRLKDFVARPFFKMIVDGTLDDAKKRQVYLDSLQIWTEGNQTLLFGRQATCHDLSFKPTFLRHLQEEVGHDDLYNDRAEKSEFKDPIMSAVTTWFLHQMFVLDNAEKAAIIHLVIESASDEYHKVAKPHLAKYINDAYFQAHEGDVAHVAMGHALLQGYSPKVYQRLRDVIEEAWDMVISMVDRVTYLVQKA